MEIVSGKPRRRRGYNRLSPTKRSVKIVRLGSKRSWKIRIGPKLRLIRLVSPFKLWLRLKNAYMNMMLRFANSTNTSNSANVFGEKRIPGARKAPATYTNSEFENRLILEIYKSMVSSLELHGVP
ncbi:hypothetical protein F511_13341 [Dorcoceras hygrometricum]|uniref:Uncharacterized protein n=1 Tax=Dorcoceras hygrometricum TaxID=472368 RepID=A0A2Z7C5Y6_9LAMI|nr:hypothetical protein F511_13341 [Dorcoceras hygrometricum]